MEVGALFVLRLGGVPAVETGREDEADFEVEVGAFLCDRAGAGRSVTHQADGGSAAHGLGGLEARGDFREVGVQRVDGNFRGGMVQYDVPAVRTVDVCIQVGDLAVHGRQHEVKRFAVGVALRWPDIDALVEALAVLADHAEKG